MGIHGYIICGVIFNFIYDLVINYLGKDHYNLRFSIAERVLVAFFWPLFLIKFTITLIKNLIN